MKVTGARLLAHTLAEAGVEIVSGIPGHTIFPFANGIAAEPRLRPFLVRHEAIAAFAADVYYRVSGKMMAVFGHTLPGAANMVAGVANAYADSSAMLVIIGETARDALGRGAYQELSRAFDGDVPNFLRHVVKRSWQTHAPLQLVEHALRAIKTAQLGRPGPTAMHVFQDVWDQEVEIPEWPSVEGFITKNRFRPDSADIDQAAGMLQRAARPLIVAGNGVNLSRAQAELLKFAEKLGAPVVTTVTGKGAFPENHPLSLGVVGWVGTACANWAGKNADVVLAVGTRLTETATSSWQPDASFNFQRASLIQCDVEPAEIANVFPVQVPLIGDAGRSLEDLTAALEKSSTRPSWDQGWRQAREEWRKVVRTTAEATGSPMPVGPVVAALRAATDGHPVNIVGDIGKHHKWVVQQFEARAGDAIVSSMGAGTMGIGPCGVVGAALGRPEAKTIAWVGDGGMAMTAFVLPTVAEHRLPIVYAVIDDGAFGEIVNIQEQRFNRTIFSEFNGSGRNPGYRLDLAAVAQACGLATRRVERPEELRSSFDWALSQDGPVLLDILVDRKSRVPSGGGSKLNDIWNYPIYPWAGARTPAIARSREESRA